MARPAKPPASATRPRKQRDHEGALAVWTTAVARHRGTRTQDKRAGGYAAPTKGLGGCHQGWTRTLAVLPGVGTCAPF